MAFRLTSVLLMLAAALAVASAAESPMCEIYKSTIDCTKSCDTSKCEKTPSGDCLPIGGEKKMQETMTSMMDDSAMGLFTKSLTAGLACGMGGAKDEASCAAISTDCAWNATADPAACGINKALADKIAANEELPKVMACQGHATDKAKCTADTNCQFIEQGSQGACSATSEVMLKGSDPLFHAIYSMNMKCSPAMTKDACTGDCEWEEPSGSEPGSCSASTKGQMTAVAEKCPTTLGGMTVAEIEAVIAQDKAGGETSAGNGRFGSILIATVFTTFAMFFAI